MKRFLILFMIVGLTATSVATAEAKRSQRKRCVEIETHKHEAFLTAKAVDAHGQAVRVQVWG